MKRSPILRKTPLRSSGPIKKRKRKRPTFERVYGSDDRVQWIKAQPCVVCGATPSENMHIRGGGVGRKADADQIIPCCSYHHGRAHVKGIETFAMLYRLDLSLLAAQTQAAWLVESDTPPLCVRCAASYAIDGTHCGACRFEVRRPCEPRAS